MLWKPVKRAESSQTQQAKFCKARLLTSCQHKIKVQKIVGNSFFENHHHTTKPWISLPALMSNDYIHWSSVISSVIPTLDTNVNSTESS